jgi:hypothetical protein
MPPNDPNHVRSRSRAGPTRRLPALIALAALLVVVLPVPVAQASIGVTPATVDLTDPPLLPGGGKRAVIHLQQYRSENTVVDVSVVPLNGGWGDASSWVGLDREGRLTLAPGMHTFTAQVNVPKATPNGEYRAGVMFTIHAPSSQQGGIATLAAVTATLLI